MLITVRFSLFSATGLYYFKEEEGLREAINLLVLAIQRIYNKQVKH